MTTNDAETSMSEEIESAELEAEEIVAIDGIDESRTEQIKWDEKVRQLMRQIFPQKVELPVSRLKDMIDDKEIDLAPQFQRRLRWTRSQKSRLIESVIMNVPIPPVFLGEDKPGKYVVLDGRQRLTALYEYLSNTFKLTTLNVWSDLNGKNFKQLQKYGDPPVASSITRRFVPAVLILHESVPEVKYEVFDRLNTGGVIAEPMEVRNAIYHGKFNNLLHELAENEAFCTLWGLPLDEKQRQSNSAYRRMIDLELVLRFFAFQEYKSFSGSLKTFLNVFMSQRNKEYRDDPSLADYDRELFISTFTRVLNFFGPDGFKRVIEEGKKSTFPSAPFADAILYAISKLPVAEDEAVKGPALAQLFSDLCLKDKAFEKAITTGTNARTSAEYRIEAATRAVLGLRPEDPVPYGR